MGGVGGAHLLTLSRLGIGHFNISDLDEFEVANFNRQAGASMKTLGRQKVEVLEEMAKNLNPEQEIKTFPNGVTEKNVDEFLDGVDLYVDGLDYFAVSARRATFAKCQEKGIPAVTAAPLGIGAAVLNFIPGGMSFEEYFRLEGKSEMEQLLSFLIGLSPAMLQRTYLADPTTVDLANHKGPSRQDLAPRRSGCLWSFVAATAWCQWCVWPSPGRVGACRSPGRLSHQGEKELRYSEP